MRIPFLAATASVLLLAGAAAAQPASSPPDAAASPAPAAAPSDATPAPSATPAPTADSTAANTSTGYNFNPGTPPAVADLAQAKAGDPGIVSNAPIPDTHANRSAFGKPNSAAGRRTKPRGN